MSKSKKIEQASELVIAIKGFNTDMTCRGFKFEDGQTYKHEGEVEACSSGFHAIEGHPLEVFNYYAPGLSVYREVELRGPFGRHGGDSKIAAAEITIRAEIKIPELVSRAVKWVMERAKTEEGGHATGDQGAASATGTQGAASATGDRGAASATGYQGAAMASGTQGAASATGDRGAAMASGPNGRVMGSDGNALFAVERGEWDGKGYPILSVASGAVGRNGIEPGVWYVAKGGKLTPHAA